MNDTDSSWLSAQFHQLDQISPEQIQKMSEDERLAYNLQRQEFNRYNDYSSSQLLDKQDESESNDNLTDSQRRRLLSTQEETKEQSYQNNTQNDREKIFKSMISQLNQAHSLRAARLRNSQEERQLIINNLNSQIQRIERRINQSDENNHAGNIPEPIDRIGFIPGDARERNRQRIYEAFRRNQQEIVDHNNQQAEPSLREQRIKRQTIFCFILGMLTIFITNYEECGIDKNSRLHLINEKDWMLVYLTISFLQVIRERITTKIDSAYHSGQMTFNQRKYIRNSVFLATETLNFIWQVYGNVIYWDQRSLPKNVAQCKQEKNYGFILSMLMMLILGYIYFVFYIIFISLFIFLKCRRMNNLNQQRRGTQQIMQSISRVKFSEELFGALGMENECIICMTPFEQEDMVTQLKCAGKHFYHTNCIESWLSQGKNQCPMCRQSIDGSNSEQARSVEII